MRTRRAASTMLATLILSLATVGTALAVKPTVEVRNDRFSFSFVDEEICPGLSIESSFEDIKRTRTVYYDQDGAELQLVIHIEGWGTFTNIDDRSLSVRSHSTRHIVFDYAAGSYTDTGVYRNVTVPGGGNILQQTGRWVETLDFDGTILAINGPHQDWLGDLAAFCEALGA